MRIIKLSNTIFDDEKCVKQFFDQELNKTEPKGKFRFTKGRISIGGIHLNEKVLFSYNGFIYYKAVSISSRCDNIDEYSTDYPHYFLIDMNSLTSVRISLHDLEKKYHQISKEKKSIVQSQGWPIICNESDSDILWDFIK